MSEAENLLKAIAPMIEKINAFRQADPAGTLVNFGVYRKDAPMIYSRQSSHNYRNYGNLYDTVSEMAATRQSATDVATVDPELLEIRDDIIRACTPSGTPVYVDNAIWDAYHRLNKHLAEAMMRVPHPKWSQAMLCKEVHMKSTAFAQYMDSARVRPTRRGEHGRKFTDDEATRVLAYISANATSKVHRENAKKALQLLFRS